MFSNKFVPRETPPPAPLPIAPAGGALLPKGKGPLPRSRLNECRCAMEGLFRRHATLRSP